MDENQKSTLTGSVRIMYKKKDIKFTKSETKSKKFLVLVIPNNVYYYIITWYEKCFGQKF